MLALWRSLSDAAGGGFPAGRSLLFLLLLGMAMQFLGIAAPGYYNHDETQWFIRSQELGSALWDAWIGQWHSMQWRPLSRTAWLLLARGLHEIPILMHAAMALIVVVSAVLLYLLLLRVFRQPSAALAGFVAFSAFPSTAWVAGWVATIADGLMMLVAVALAHVLLTDRNEAVESGQGTLPFQRPLRSARTARQCLVAGLFALGLLCKEAVVVLPAALAGLCLLVKPWRGLLWACCSTGAIAVAFLALRLDVISSGGGRYSVSAGNILGNAWLYWQYPWNLRTVAPHFPPLQEIPAWAAFAAVTAFAPVLWLIRRRRPRLAAAYVLQYFVLASPALLIAGSAGHYLYGAALPVAAVFALAFRREEGVWVKAYTSSLIGILLAHSAAVQFHLYGAAKVQTRLHDVVSSIVTSHDAACGHQGTQFAIVPDRGAKQHHLGRAFTEVSRIGEVPIEGRLAVVVRSGEGQGDIPEGDGVSSPSRRREALLSEGAVRKADLGCPAGAARPRCRRSRLGAWGGP